MTDRRIFFLGVNTGFVTDGLPDCRYVEFYQSRSSPQLHCSIIGNIVVPGGYASNGATPTLSSDSIWAEIAGEIRARGSVPGIQLATAWQGYVGSKKFVGTEPKQVIPEARQLMADLGPSGVSAVLDSFDEAATIAIGHGFGHVQLHAAHGYLLNLMVDSRINPFAESVLERLAMLATRLAGEGIENSVRISLRTGDLDFDAHGASAFHDAIADLPFDYVDLSSGFYNIDKRLIYPARPDVLAARLQESLAVAHRHPERAFILSGRAMRPLAAHLPRNVHLGICRDLIANPNFLTQPHKGCQNHSKCHYFSRGDDHLTCARWSET